MPPPEPAAASPMDYLEAALQMAEEGKRDANGYLDEQSHGALASLLPMISGGRVGEGPEGQPAIERPSPDDLVELPALLVGKLAIEDEEPKADPGPTDTHGDFAPEPPVTRVDRDKKPPRKKWKVKRRSKRRK